MKNYIAEIELGEETIEVIFFATCPEHAHEKLLSMTIIQFPLLEKYGDELYKNKNLFDWKEL